ncbi:amino acid/amide ABC transporter ATP-binding protein 2 (HAAT family) [Aliiruegeria haliotis]|uniref:Amino acid/amide ABC transporter ATP-binding protein 2 (HAAT family) n=1 Tax=Aliiruegeria haliotis TaxID=1280846 RepID=A0A2T0RVX3_9RHOB|nr:ABC transporter ATP-binding protein [Aliiruegeria haliotis]PRY25314.1 amino acid/amide ABC transporter ATP-binding protein 2 (HAAT family) [Aliiruegeria haliotis]
MTAPLLKLDNVSAAYGAAEVLFDLSFDIAPGEIVALMGRNGMGKTTTIRTICRMLGSTHGHITFDGHELTSMSAHKAAQLGLGLVPEGRRCFAPLTVAENLTVASRPGPWDLAAVTTLFPRLRERLGQSAGSLSGGEQQMLAIGRALMTNPRLLLLDEATEGLAPVVRQEIWAAIGELADTAALSILIVDKSLRELRALAHRAVILEKGRKAWEGPIDALTDDISARHLGV